MKKYAFNSILFIVLFYISCSTNKQELPIKTSLGNLVKIEKHNKLAYKESSEIKTVKAYNKTTFYFLNFYGAKKITCNVDKNQIPLAEYEILDNNNKNYI